LLHPFFAAQFVTRFWEKIMSVPDYQSLMLPVLEQSASGEVRIGEVVDRLAKDLNLSEDDLAELIPSGKQTTFSNRVHWAKSYLKQAGLVEATKRAHFRISERGKEVLKSGIDKIDINYLKKFPEFIAFQNRSSSDSLNEESSASPKFEVVDVSQTPDDLMRVTNRAINLSLGQEIIDRIVLGTPAFFERIVVTLLLSMGYGGSFAEAGRAIGKSGDDGIDGVIDQDTLGLDRVYIQAKKYQHDNTIGPGAIRDFFGSLDMHKASKGLFVTTSSFTKSAIDTADKLGKRIVLIDGRTLAQLMIRFNVGCRVEEVFEFKKIDEEFFD
jgi:restriction system protein